MTASASTVADRAADTLGLESEFFLNPDIVGFGEALALAVQGLARHPAKAAGVTAQFAAGLAALAPVVLARSLGHDRPGPFASDAPDRRFADSTWTEHPAFFALRQYYLAVSRLTEQLISAAELARPTDRKAQLAAGLVLDLLGPTNFLAINPAALKRAFETAGRSVWKGSRNFVADLVHNGGRAGAIGAVMVISGLE